MEADQARKDHDLLIELCTEVRGMRIDIQNLTTNLSSRVTSLEQDKQARSDSEKRYIASDRIHNDHETRLRTLEKESEDHMLVKKVVYGAVGLILVAVLSAIVYLVIKQ